MQRPNTYIFESDRLGFRHWRQNDLQAMSLINADPRVMEFFPATQSSEQTMAFISRMNEHFASYGYCYFAVEEKQTGALIGFIGLLQKNNLPDQGTVVDIGWRLSPAHWNKGYALEGAKACLNFAFHKLSLSRVVATAPKLNLRSENVMKRLGMRKIKEFKHPELNAYPHLETCVLYEIENNHDALFK